MRYKPLHIIFSVLLTVLLAFAFLASAGSLTPSAYPTSTMNTLEEIYNSVASTFDSSGLTANANGSVLGMLKYVNNNLFWASSSGNVYNLNAGNISIGTTSASAKFTIQSAGTSSSLAFSIFNSAGAPLVSLNDSANFFIGTSTVGSGLATSFHRFFVYGHDNADFILGNPTSGAPGSALRFLANYGSGPTAGAYLEVGNSSTDPSATLWITRFQGNGNLSLFNVWADTTKFFGKVGVGTSTVATSSTFTIRSFGDSTATNAFSVFNLSGSSLLNINDAGGIDIATTTTGYIHAIFTPDVPTNTNNDVVSIQVTPSSGTTTYAMQGLAVTMFPGYTGSVSSAAGAFRNHSASTGITGLTTGRANYGTYGITTGTTTGDNVGVDGWAQGGNRNIGGVFNAYQVKDSATNMGVFSIARNTGSTSTEIGGYFGLYDSEPASFLSSALIADNGVSTNPIFLGLDNNTEVFRIADGGSVLIGTTTNSARLTIQGAGNTTSTYAFQIYNSAGTSLLEINDLGGLKVNSSDPDYAAIRVFGTASVGGTFLSGSVTATGTPLQDSFRMRQLNIFGDSDYLIFEKTDGNLEIPDGGIAFSNIGNNGITTYSMLINGRGNVAIGTTSIYDSASDTNGTRLTIQSSGNTSVSNALSILNSDGTSLLGVRDDGKVGIGAGSPSSRLYVVGSDIALASETGALTTFYHTVATTTGGFSHLLKTYWNTGTYTGTDYGTYMLTKGSSDGSIVHSGTVNTSYALHAMYGNVGDVFTNVNVLTANATFFNPGGVSIDTIQNLKILNVTSNIYANQVGNVYGLYVSDLNNVGTSSTFGIYQAGASDKNFFAGYVGIGTSSPQDALHVIGDIRTSACASDGAGDVSCVDVAESYYTSENISAGELVSFDTTFSANASSTFAIKKASAGSPMLGIVSTRPALLIEGYQSRLGGPQTAGTYNPGDKAPVALVGRVPVKVNLDGGAIGIGDPISISQTPGIGMRATSSGMIVGYALEPYAGSGTSTILVFVNLGYHKLTLTASGTLYPDWLVGSDGKLTATSDVNFGGNSIVNVKSILSSSGSWSIDESGRITGADLDVQRATIRSKLIMTDEVTGQTYCVKIRDGEFIKDPCVP